MNKIVPFIVTFVLWPGLVLATPNPDTGPGCGLGKQVWSGASNQKNILPQVFMATTNVTGFQTFGISSGTSGCSNDGLWWASNKAAMFAELNADALTQEMAQGGGEHLASLAVLLGVPPAQHRPFFAMTQERYTALTTAGELSSIAMIQALNDAISADPVLARVSLNE